MPQVVNLDQGIRLARSSPGSNNENSTGHTVYTVFQVIMQITYRKDFSEVFVLFGHTFLDNWYQSQTG